MAIGLRSSSGGGGDFLPIVKYDARAGKMFRSDRTAGTEGWETNNVEITNAFTAVFDMENIEVGWMCFAPGSPPSFHLVPVGEDYGEAPSDMHKDGIRVMIKLGKDAGGDVRELSSTAKSFLGAFDALHDAYLTGVKASPGMLPVVAMKETRPVATNYGGKTTTNYAPVFKITGWVKRPADLVFQPKGGDVTAKPAVNGHATPPAASSRPATPPRVPVEAEAADAMEEFG